MCTHARTRRSLARNARGVAHFTFPPSKLSPPASTVLSSQSAPYSLPLESRDVFEWGVALNTQKLCFYMFAWSNLINHLKHLMTLRFDVTHAQFHPVLPPPTS